MKLLSWAALAMTSAKLTLEMRAAERAFSVNASMVGARAVCTVDWDAD